MEDRIQKAVELFRSGYNCSQSVVAAFADMYGFTQEREKQPLQHSHFSYIWHLSLPDIGI